MLWVFTTKMPNDNVEAAGTPPAAAVMYYGGGNIHNLDRLEGISNYNSWKFSMKMALTMDGLWECVEGNGDAARDGRALARICLGLKSTCYQYVRDARTSKEAWTKLAQVFEDKGLYRRVVLLRQLHHAEYCHYDSMSEYIDKIMVLVQQLADIGRVIDDAEVAELLLSGLPEEFDALVSNLETACITTGLSSELVRTRLLQEEFRKNSNVNGVNSGGSSATNVAFVSKRKSVVCHYCKKPGHFKAKCFKLKRDQKKNGGDKTLLVSAMIAHSADDWIVDSGCTSHMCNNKDLISDYRNITNLVCIANSDKLESEGLGNVNISLNNNDVRKILDVMHVPQLSSNLLSVSKMVEKGLTVTFSSDGCSIYESCKVVGSCIGTAKNRNGIFVLDGFVCKSVSEVERSSKLLQKIGQETGKNAIATLCVPVDVWHKRLGHLSLKGMSALKDGFASGVMFQNSDAEQKLKGCVSCLEGKQIKKSFPNSAAKRTDKPLELIHSDVCGPMQECSWGGARYLLTFTDDYSRKTFGYLLRNKSEVMSCFINFKALTEKQTGFAIKSLRSDNGGEYCNKKFVQYLNNEGIIHQTTVPYCPQQNGVSERLNRTLMEKARCLLQDSRLCKRYWAEAVMTAIYLKNRSPTTALSGRIPEEVWTGSSIDLSHLRVFGCMAYSLIPEQRRKKLDPKSKQYIFVGYGETCKGYRLIEPSNPSRIIMSRNVEFMEDKFYNDISHKCHNEDININDDFIFYEFTNNKNVLMSNNELCDNNEFNVNDVSSVHVSGVYCSGSEEEHSLIESLSGADSSGESSSSGDTSAEPSSLAVTGIGLPSVTHSRPVRSTRGTLPMRYDEYDLSMFVQENIFNEPLTYDEAMAGSNSREWQSAMQNEYDSLIQNGVWKLVDRPMDENVIKCKWIYKIKHDAAGKFDKYKARLVARGFTQKQGVDYNETFSPVVRHSTMRILFSLANDFNMNIEHIDVTTAFLNGELNELIYMEQPVGFINKNDSKVCLLLKSIYGLKQASRMWNSKVHDLLTKNDYIQIKCEPCVYMKEENNCITMVALYVDDFYIFTNSSNNELLHLLEKAYNVKNLGALKNCLGMKVTRDRSKGILTLDQSEYIKKLLLRFGMINCKHVSTPMTVDCKLLKSDNNTLRNDVYQYRQLIGSLMYLSVCTRPDITFACSQLSQFNNSFDNSHWLAAKRILRYLAGTINYGLCFTKGDNFDLTAYADADWANDPNDRKSYTGFVIKLGNNVINWGSRRQRCVALSSTEAEYLAISDVSKDICFTTNFFCQKLFLM